MQTNFRESHLFKIFKLFEERALPLDLLLNRYFRASKSLGSKDRHFIAETAFMLLRWKGLLDWFSPIPPSWKSRLDVYQKHSLNDLMHTPSLLSHVKCSFPEWLFLKLKAQYGIQLTEEICLTSNSQAPATIRVNQLKSSRDDLFESLRTDYEIQKTTVSPWGITFLKRANYFETSLYKAGHFEAQDEGSQLLADLVQPKPGDHVLDFCAGSGGKTLAFAHLMKNKGQIYLHDIRHSPLQQARKRLARAGIQNVQFLESDNKNLNKLHKKMDWVLIDVPCSGTGTLRRHPHLKWELKEETLSSLIEAQRKIFAEAVSYLHPNGKLVYGTCSILQEENEHQIDYFLRTCPVEVVGTPLKMVPTSDGPDGFYAVVFQYRNMVGSGI